MPVSSTHPVWSPSIGAPTEAFWGSNVAEAVVQRFDTAAQRDARWTAPPHGAVCVITTSPPTMWQRQGNAWRQIGPSILADPYGGAQRIGGDLRVDGFISVDKNPTADDHVTRRGWINTQLDLRVKVSGDTMTGPLLLQKPNGDPDVPDGPRQATNKQYVDGQVNTKVNKTGDTVTGPLTIGQAPQDGPGIKLWDNGAYSSTINTADTWNLNLRRGSAADAVDQRFINFTHGAAPGIACGSITMEADNHVKYNTTSDYRLKERLGPVTDAAERVRRLAARAFNGRWLGGAERSDFLNAHDIAEVAPYAVCGDKDAVHEDGRIEPQQVDYGSLVPMLISALGDALGRIAHLEARLA